MENDSSRPTSHLMPQPFGSLMKSALTSMPASQSSSTGAPRNVPCTPTGKPLSETALDGLRQLAGSAKEGHLVEDESLLESLRQVLGSRLATRKNWRKVYDKDGGYDEIFDGYSVSLEVLNDTEVKLLEAVEYLNRPISPKQAMPVSEMLTRMRVSMLRRNENEDDIEMLVDTSMALCSQYPFDIVKSLCQKWLFAQKFFPLPCEMRDDLDEAVALRRALLRCFERARRTSLTGGSSAPSALPPHCDRHDKPKTAWTAQDWADHIADAEGMLDLAEKNPTMFDPEGWRSEIEKRKAECANRIENSPGNFAAGAF